MTHAPAPLAYCAQRHFIGFITPSGNTVVERITQGIVGDLPEVSAHFSRTPVFGSADPSPDAYALPGLLAAAQLLAHLNPDVLVWNGSKGAGIGLRHDEALAEEITRSTGIAATTSILGLRSVLARRGLSRLAIVTPYNDAGQAKTLACLAREGYHCVAEAHAGYSDNLSYASVPLEDIAAMMRSVVTPHVQAIVTLCTNFPAAVLAAQMEAELGLPVIDSTALGVWAALDALGADMRPAAARWGRLFDQGPRA